jgi:predicted ATP-grasp superfamily ATP-dependent carboligase
MAESAARAGFAVTSLDAFGDLDHHPGVRAYSLPRDFCLEFSPSAIVEVARTIESDAVAYLSPFENHPALVEQLAEGRQLWGNDAAVLRRARDHRMLPSIGEVHSDRWLLKPRASGGGHGIRWWTPRDPVPSGSYVQPYIEGAPGSIVFVAAGGNCVPLALTIQLVGEASFGASGFRYCGSILCHSERNGAGNGQGEPCHSERNGAGNGQGEPCHSERRREAPEARYRRSPEGSCHSERSARAAPAEARNRDRPERGLPYSATQLAKDLTRRLNLVGVNCIDFIDHDDVAIPVEINPRWSASMELVELAHGISMFGVHAAACTAGKLPSFNADIATIEPMTLGKAIVFARHDVLCGDTSPWLDDPDVRDVPHPGERIPAARPVCTVFARGSTVGDCHASLVARANSVYEILDAWASIPA